MIVTLTPVEIQIGLNSQGCGHQILMSRDHYDACMQHGRAWYCTICGKQRVFIGETEIAKLRRERDAALQREETRKAMCRNLEEALSKEQKSKARLKKRVKNGVCPCCTRSFQNLKQHIATKHPDFTKESV
jgi:hypothetical protein